WSYQPNFESLSEVWQLGEIYVGGEEKTKNELIVPIKIDSNNKGNIKRFKEPKDLRAMYKEIATWVMDDVEATKAKGCPDAQQYVELVFPASNLAPILSNLFTFDDDTDLPNWEFERVFMIPEEESKSVEVVVMSEDNKQKIQAKNNKNKI